jgi:hypothetical protein
MDKYTGYKLIESNTNKLIESKPNKSIESNTNKSIESNTNKSIESKNNKPKESIKSKNKEWWNTNVYNKNEQLKALESRWWYLTPAGRMSLALILVIAIIIIVVSCILSKNKLNCPDAGIAYNGKNCNKKCSQTISVNTSNGDCIYCENGLALNKLNCNKICNESSINLSNGDCKNCPNGISELYGDRYKEVDPITPDDPEVYPDDPVDPDNPDTPVDCPNGIAEDEIHCNATCNTNDGNILYYNNFSGQCLTRSCLYGIAEDGNHCNDKCRYHVGNILYYNNDSGQCVTKSCQYGIAEDKKHCKQNCKQYNTGKTLYYNNSSGQCEDIYCDYGIAQDGSHCNKECANTTYKHYGRRSNGECIMTKYCKYGFDGNTCICKYGEMNDGICTCPNGQAINNQYCNEKCKNGRYIIMQNSNNGACQFKEFCPYGVNGNKCYWPIPDPNPPSPPSPNNCNDNNHYQSIGGDCVYCPYGVTKFHQKCNRE